MMDISLTVSSDGPTVLGSVLRSNQAYLELLSEKYTTDYGIAFCCPRFEQLACGNEFREVWVESADEAGAALASANSVFEDFGVPCHRWTLAEAQNPRVVEPVLLDAGYERHERIALALTAWPAPVDFPHVRVLPARPMRSAYEKIVTNASRLFDKSVREQFVAAAIDRLDGHRMDMFVAMVDGQPAGVAALFQVGDIGRIVDLYVCPEFRRRQVASALLHHIFKLAHRLLVRVVCVESADGDKQMLALLSRHGFIEIDRAVEFLAPSWPRIDSGDGGRAL